MRILNIRGKYWRAVILWWYCFTPEGRGQCFSPARGNTEELCQYLLIDTCILTLCWMLYLPDHSAHEVFGKCRGLGLFVKLFSCLMDRKMENCCVSFFLSDGQENPYTAVLLQDSNVFKAVKCIILSWCDWFTRQQGISSVMILSWLVKF